MFLFFSTMFLSSFDEVLFLALVSCVVFCCCGSSIIRFDVFCNESSNPVHIGCNECFLSFCWLFILLNQSIHWHLEKDFHSHSDCGSMDILSFLTFLRWMCRIIPVDQQIMKYFASNNHDMFIVTCILVLSHADAWIELMKLPLLVPYDLLIIYSC